MNPVTSTSTSGMADMIQRISSPGSPLASAGLSASQIQKVLEKASPSDVVKLSDQAKELQQLNTVLAGLDNTQSAQSGSTAPATTSSGALQSLLAGLSSASASKTSGSNTGSSQSASATSLASQMASYQRQLQAEGMQTLFGSSSSSGTSSALLSLLG